MLELASNAKWPLITDMRCSVYVHLKKIIRCLYDLNSYQHFLYNQYKATLLHYLKSSFLINRNDLNKPNLSNPPFAGSLHYTGRDTLKMWQARNHPWLELSEVRKDLLFRNKWTNVFQIYSYTYIIYANIFHI